ncbi:hypothetical protein AWB94_04845 [Mycolicibacterium canariasense]|nr:hypothetical protein AWB94_04845 [Mycolicibacterium canariasense]
MVMGKWPWEILFPKPPTPEPSPIEQRLPYGNVGIRATHDRVAIVDYDTNTVLASTSWRIRPESVVQLTQTGRVYAVTVADDDNENTPRRTVLQYIRPALPGEELDEIQEGDHV